MSIAHDTYERDRIEDELRTTQAQFEAFVNNSAVAFIVSDLTGIISRVNHTFETLFGWSAEEAVGNRLPIVPARFEAAFQQHLIEKNWEITASETIRQRKDGSEFPASETITPIRDANGTVFAYARILRDITLRKQEERRVMESEQRYKSLFEHNPDAVFSLNTQGEFTSANPAVHRISGFAADELQGLSFIHLVVEEDRLGAVESFRQARKGTPQHVEMTILHKTGRRVYLNFITVPIVIDGDIVGIYGIAKDITEQKRTEEMINYMAYHDALTELPNRRLFQDRLGEALKAAEAGKHKVAVLMLDLDRFKYVNDSLGHDIGDQMLCMVSQRLLTCVREGDTVARMGGDEFTVLLPSVVSIDGALRVAERILGQFRDPLTLDGSEFHVTPSIGIALYPDHGENLDTLLKHADTAMYQVKEHSKNAYRVFCPSMVEESLQRRELERELGQALERDEFVLYYQPQVNGTTGEITGMEALIRWQHPSGLRAPGQFIPLAEETGLIVPIGEWVIRTACRQCKSWIDQGFQPLRMAVNLSLMQFEQENLPQKVADILEETGLPPQYLELEITESIAMANTDSVVAKLQKLVELGIQISIDDFGTGFSSLSYLKKFPIHKLKIDRSFIVDITNQSDSSIVSAIVMLAKSLGLNVIVEGVETETQRNYLPQLGCDEMQGFLFSTPLPPQQFERLLADGRIA